MSKYGISEALHSELPGLEDMIIDFLERKVVVYIKSFEFAKFCLLLSQFLFDILGYYQIHLSQLSIIGAAKVSHFKINCPVLYIVPTLSLFRVFYTPSFNSGWMSFSKRLNKNTPQCYTNPLDSLKNWNNCFFWVDERVFSTIVDWRTSALKDGMPTENTYSSEAVMILNTHRTPIQKQLEALLCLVGLSRRYYLGDEVYPTFFHDDDRDMDLLSLIRAPNPTKVKTGTHSRTAYEVPLLTASHVIQMEDPAAGTDSSRAKRTGLLPRVPERKSLTAIELGMGSNHPVPASHGAPVDVSDPNLLSFAEPQSCPSADVTQSSNGAAMARDPKSENISFTFMAKENEIKNLETLLDAESDMKKVAEGRSTELSKELENIRALFLDLQEIGHGLRLAVMKCEESTKLRPAFADIVSVGIAKGVSEGRKNEVKHRKANLSLEAIEAYDPEAEAKYITAFHALKDLKYPIVDQLGSLKDVSMDVIMASLHLKSDTGDDAPQPLGLHEEILLANAIAANVSRAKKKKKSRVVCRTYGVSSVHHARSDGVPVSMPTVASQGLAILLADGGRKTEISKDAASPRLLRSRSLHVMHN
uniref:Transposase (Putative), gypsy type n=1 Tax=Tanacetum cinerariifolium TaxID=118510 RepID=A0A6L2KY90_TANCI|nr:hypothetical protein [Tanacetum cinerariifolium]